MLQDAANRYVFTLVSHKGEEEEVEYRLPSLRGMNEYFSLQSDDARLVAFLLGIKVEDTDKYTQESLFALLEEVKERMDPPLAAWLKRQAAKAQSIQSLVEGVSGKPGKISSAK